MKNKKLSDDLARELARGINEFNLAQFFECHETLESVWMVYHEPDRELIQGIIQAAVGYYHLGRANNIGAFKLFSKAAPRLQKFPANTLGLDTQELSQAVSQLMGEFSSPPAENKDFKSNNSGHIQSDSFPQIKFARTESC